MTPDEERARDVRRRQRRNAVVTALALVAVVILIYAISIARMTAGR